MLESAQAAQDAVDIPALEKALEERDVKKAELLLSMALTKMRDVLQGTSEPAALRTAKMGIKGAVTATMSAAAKAEAAAQCRLEAPKIPKGFEGDKIRLIGELSEEGIGYEEITYYVGWSKKDAGKVKAVLDKYFPQLKAGVPMAKAPIKAKRYAVTWSQAGKFSRAIGADELRSLGVYQSREYKVINSALRKKETLSGELKVLLRDLDYSISQCVAEKEAVVYRGVKNIKLKVGQVFQDRAYVSTSLDEKLIDRFGKTKLEIIVPKDANFAFVKTGSSLDMHEHEVLLPRGSKFKVVSYNKKTNTWVLKLLIKGS